MAKKKANKQRETMTSQAQRRDGLVCRHVSDPCDCPCVCHRADVCLCQGYKPVGQCDTVIMG